MIIFIVNDFFMRIVITENQYIRLFEQEEVKCVPTGDTTYRDVDISVYDVMNNELSSELFWGHARSLSASLSEPAIAKADG